MDKTRQERYNMIYGNTARKIEDLAAGQCADSQGRQERQDQEENIR